MTETDARTDGAERTAAVPAGAEATFREIRQQPEVWRESARLVREHRARIDAFLAPLLAREKLRIIFTGAGTSAFTGDVVAPTIAKATGRRVDSVATTDLVSNPRHYLAEDVPTLLVSFARSGNSPESVATTHLAEEILGEVHHFVITCNTDGELAHEQDENQRALVLRLPPRTNDEGFAMTSSFTSMLLTALLVFLGDVLGDAEELVERLAADAQSVIDRWTAIAGRASSEIKRVVYLGSGPLAALAEESALKLLELSAGRTVGFHDSALGFRHGPKAVLDSQTLAVVFLSADPYTRRYDLDILAELRAALGDERVIAVASGELDEPGAVRLAGLADVDDGFLAPVFVIVAQILAVSFALAVGATPDNPFPGGAVNRVVKGVRIHSLDDGSVRD